MTSRRPYILRALYEWIVDNNLTPHLLVNAMREDVEVPQDYVKDGQIVLNITPNAVQGLLLGNDVITFNARFDKIPTNVSVPIEAVMGIYAPENGQGVMFEDEDGHPLPPDPSGSSVGGSVSSLSSPRPKGKPSLKVVK